MLIIINLQDIFLGKRISSFVREQVIHLRYQEARLRPWRYIKNTGLERTGLKAGLE